MTDRTQAIHAMIRPQSIAIIGASSNLEKVNGRPLKHLLEKGYAGRIYPINPNYEEIAGLTCYPSASELPEVADVAIIAVRAGLVPAAIEDIGHKGIKAAVIFSSGFGELGETGKALETKILKRARALGIVLLGPNCLGFINSFDKVYATFSQYADGDKTHGGPVAFVTQSGAFGTAIAALANQRSLGLGYFVNTGNEIDASFSELMSGVIEDPRIRVAAGYLEGLHSGKSLITLARRCHELGKPLVLTKVGRKESGAKAAASHTGALAVQDDVFDNVLKQYGVLRARNEEQMLDMIEALAYIPQCEGSGLGIVTQSGGAGVMMADRAEEVDLHIPTLSDNTVNRLQGVMPEFGAMSNPVDVTGQFVAEPKLLRDSVLAVMDDENIDITIVWLQLMHRHVDVLVEVFREIRQQSQKPLIVCWVAAPPEARKRLQELNIAVFQAGERAVEAAGAVARFHDWNRRLRENDPSPLLSDAKTPMAFDDGIQPTADTVALLSNIGIPMTPVTLATSEESAIRAWKNAGRKIALKIESPDIPHKTDIGGVLLGMDNEASIRSGYRELMQRAHEAMPQARILGVIVQPMDSGTTELVIGVKRDPIFGMMVMVGLGGIMIEVLRDVVFRLAPFSADEGLRMLAQLRASAVLDGARGKPAANRNHIANLLSRLSMWATAHESAVEELDLNPILIDGDNIHIVDCLLSIRNNGT